MDIDNAFRAVHVVDLRFTAPPDRVFPLLCPVREYDWIERWDGEIVYTDSGIAELGCIFRTRSHDMEEIWTVSRYEPERAIEFIRVVAGVRVTKMDFALRPGDENTTLATVTYTHTALSPAGADAIRAITPEIQQTVTRNLETMANHYLRTGDMLRQPTTDWATATYVART